MGKRWNIDTNERLEGEYFKNIWEIILVLILWGQLTREGQKSGFCLGNWVNNNATN